MAIVMMCDAGTPGAVRDDYWSANTKTDIWTVKSHVGVVVGTGEVNGYDDSDFYAVVWNEAEGKPERVTYASTRGWTYPNGASVDATDEVKAKYDAYLKAEATAAAAAHAARTAAKPAVGKTAVTVRSVRGKSAVEAGVTGTIVWTGTCKFSGKSRVGLKVSDDKVVFIAASAVEVVGATE
jgi:hypothetical protein